MCFSESAPDSPVVYGGVCWREHCCGSFLSVPCIVTAVSTFEILRVRVTPTAPQLRSRKSCRPNRRPECDISNSDMGGRTSCRRQWRPLWRPTSGRSTPACSGWPCLTNSCGATSRAKSPSAPPPLSTALQRFRRSGECGCHTARSFSAVTLCLKPVEPAERCSVSVTLLQDPVDLSEGLQLCIEYPKRPAAAPCSALPVRLTWWSTGVSASFYQFNSTEL